MSTSTTIKRPVPTMSSHGWVYQVQEKCDFMLAHFFLTDGLQSYVFDKSISNLQQIISDYSNDLTGMTSALRTTLNQYFMNYFDAATVEVSIDASTTNPNVHEIKLYINITDNGKTYSIGKLLREMDGKFAIVMDLNNNGTE